MEETRHCKLVHCGMFKAWNWRLLGAPKAVKKNRAWQYLLCQPQLRLRPLRRCPRCWGCRRAAAVLGAQAAAAVDAWWRSKGSNSLLTAPHTRPLPPKMFRNLTLDINIIEVWARASCLAWIFQNRMWRQRLWYGCLACLKSTVVVLWVIWVHYGMIEIMATSAKNVQKAHTWIEGRKQ